MSPSSNQLGSVSFAGKGFVAGRGVKHHLYVPVAFA
jgi:hypothetical protein